MENESSGLKKSSKKKKDKKKQGSKKPDIAQELYNEVRESNFTRTISNPDAVIKKRREQKVRLLWVNYNHGKWRLTRKSVQEDIRLSGQFFWVIRLTGQLENLDRLTVLVM